MKIIVDFFSSFYVYYFLFCFFSGIRKNENGVPEDEENFEEAIKNVNTALNPTKVTKFKSSWLP